MIQTFPNDFRKRRKDAGAVAATQKTNSSFKLGSKDDFAMFVDVFANAVARALPKQKADYMSPMSLAPGVSPKVTELAQQRMAMRTQAQQQDEALELQRSQLDYEKIIKQQQMELERSKAELEAVKAQSAIEHTQALTKNTNVSTELATRTMESNVKKEESQADVATMQRDLMKRFGEMQAQLETLNSIYSSEVNRVKAVNAEENDRVDRANRQANTSATLQNINQSNQMFPLDYNSAVNRNLAEEINLQVGAATVGDRIRGSQIEVDAAEAALKNPKKEPSPFATPQNKILEVQAKNAGIAAAVEHFLGKDYDSTILKPAAESVNGELDIYSVYNALPEDVRQKVNYQTFSDIAVQGQISSLGRTSQGQFPVVEGPDDSLAANVGNTYTIKDVKVPVIGTLYNPITESGRRNLQNFFARSSKPIALIPGANDDFVGIAVPDATSGIKLVFDKQLAKRALTGAKIWSNIAAARMEQDAEAELEYQEYLKNVLLPAAEAEKNKVINEYTYNGL